MVELFGALAEEDSDEKVRKRRHDAARMMLADALAKHPVAANYNILILYDDTILVRGDADSIYTALQQTTQRKDILLVLNSGGGRVEPAYLIGKLCRYYAANRVVVVVPRRAKSAATLICCAADELHLGAVSELGPIDPQINDYPALGLGDSIRHIANLVSEHPKSAKMFAEYLSLSVRPIDLGYYERVAESAAQYAQRLLEKPRRQLPRTPQEIAKTLVYTYKDHGFVIDLEEAREVFGSDMIKTGTPEYALGNAIYDRLSLIKRVFEVHELEFYWVGSPDSDCTWYRKRKPASSGGGT